MTINMKNKLLGCCLILSCSLSVIAMEKLSGGDREELLDCIGQIQFAHKMGSSYFMGSSQTFGGFVSSQISIMEGVLDRNSINHPSKKTFGWLGELEKELTPKEEKEVREVNRTVDISGIDKKALLRGLYSMAEPQGRGVFRYYIPNDQLSDSDAEKILEMGDIQYLRGRVMKIDISGDSVDTFFYDRDNGAGAAEALINFLRRQ